MARCQGRPAARHVPLRPAQLFPAAPRWMLEETGCWMLEQRDVPPQPPLLLLIIKTLNDASPVGDRSVPPG